MITEGATPSYPQGIMPIYGVCGETISSSLVPNSSSQSTNHTSFLYNLSILKDKVHQVQSLANIFMSSDHGQPPESTAIAMPTIGTLIQEIIATASSMMFSCQKMAPLEFQGGAQNVGLYTNHHDSIDDQWYGENYNNCYSTSTSNIIGTSNSLPHKLEISSEGSLGLSHINDDIVELDAVDLLAKYTHYCQVCNKGFKRDANLRMHMRAHGDEYKSSAALINPMKNRENIASGENIKTRKYSCPQEGCRWNKKHVKFQPLKSMICVKNHYKRSHCPKMYVCKRCNRKKFSVLSDLRTHEKHCGDLKWQCSCGTTFSRKDKLIGHVALFVGHTPVTISLNKMEIKCSSNAI
ncbi:hypothetical protein RD792_009832 [Penstemon davidsonii]|uniref:C2H2-type domain-containing protein n=1 Tax=Penstemon davidsonii TaxID=160366 RepID=A0ABR0D070_9LAMI|nr:hypothetical protein RD792_009832 [Penstemon davidsonii]